MKITVPRKSVLAAVDACCAVAAKHASNLTLESIVIRADTNATTASATDGTRAILYPIAGVEVAGEGVVVVDARALSQRLHALTEGPVVLEAKDAKLVVRYAGTRYTLPTREVADAPAHPKRGGGSKVTIAASVLAAGLERAIPFSSKDTSRAYIWGVFVESTPERLRFCATNSHAAAALVYPPIGTFAALVPLPACEAIVALCGTAEGDATLYVAADGGWIFVEVGDVLLSLQLCNAQFAPLDQVLPKSVGKKSIVASRAGLIAGVRAASVSAEKERFALKETKIPKLFVDVDGGSLLISTESTTGEASVNVACEVPNEPFSPFAVNAKYLLDGLNAFAATKISIASDGGFNPIAFHAEGDPSVAIVMPVAL